MNIYVILDNILLCIIFWDKNFWDQVNAIIYFKGKLRKKASICQFSVDVETKWSILPIRCVLSGQYHLLAPSVLQPWSFCWLLLFFHDCGASSETVHTRQKFDDHHNCGLMWWPYDNDWKLNSYQLIYEVNVLCLFSCQIV